jgi:putative DNA primase/helicase
VSTLDPLAWLAEQGAKFIPVYPPTARVPSPGKQPIGGDWTKRPHDLVQIRAEVQNGNSVGLITGEPSGLLGLLDIDERFQKFQAKFPEYANSPRIARANAPNKAKLLIRVTEPVPSAKWKPFPDEPPQAEWLFTGNQGVIPPSIHPSGEPYELIDHDQPIPVLTPKKLDQLWFKWTGKRLIESEPRKKRTTRKEPAGRDPELERIVEEVHRRFDMVAYACQELNAGQQRENADEVRIFGQGGMLINEREQVWNCFGEGDGKGTYGGDCLALVAHLKFGDLDTSGARFFEVLEAAADFAGVTVPEEYRPGATQVRVATDGSPTQPRKKKKEPRQREGDRQPPPAVALDEVLPLAPAGLVIKSCKAEQKGAAELFFHCFEERLKYDRAAKLWYYWSTHFWVQDHTGRVRWLVSGQLADQYLRTAANLQKKAEEPGTDDDARANLIGIADMLIKRAKQLRYLKWTNEVLKYASHLFETDGGEWDSARYLLGVKNGVLDLRTGELRPGFPEDHIRTITSTPWKGIDAPAPRWERFLSEIYADADDPAALIAYLQRVYGYALTGTVEEHILLVLYGEGGRNGKDTLLSAIQSVLGDFARPVSQDVLLMARGRSAGSATPHIMALQGRRIVWVSETNEGASLNSAQVKFLTGGGDLTGRDLFKDQVTFPATHTMLLITNNKPHAPADDQALWERVALVPHNMQFLTDPDPDNPFHRPREIGLKRALQAEASGILAWLIRGCLAWQELGGLNEPAMVKAATEEYQSEEDLISIFLEECCTIDPDIKTPANTLYNTYKTWVEEGSRGRPMSATAFGRRMTKRFEKVKERSGMVYLGVGILYEGPSPNGKRAGLVHSVQGLNPKTQRSQLPPSRNDYPLKRGANPAHPAHSHANGRPSGGTHQGPPPPPPPPEGEGYPRDEDGAAPPEYW